MGQKVNPHGLRVGVIKDWDSRWFANKKDFGATLVEDVYKRQLYCMGVLVVSTASLVNQSYNPFLYFRF